MYTQICAYEESTNGQASPSSEGLTIPERRLTLDMITFEKPLGCSISLLTPGK